MISGIRACARLVVMGETLEETKTSLKRLQGEEVGEVWVLIQTPLKSRFDQIPSAGTPSSGGSFERVVISSWWIKSEMPPPCSNIWICGTVICEVSPRSGERFRCENFGRMRDSEPAKHHQEMIEPSTFGLVLLE